jgi:hypothetical protein
VETRTSGSEGAPAQQCAGATRLRVAVAFESADLAWILLVSPHTNDPALDIYTELYRIIGMKPESDAGRTKPPCCDEHDQAPAVLGDLAEAILANAQQFRRTRTRGKRT